jgi:hypothetical protein
MPVSMGILCERCKTVYFIRPSGKSHHIHYERKREEFRFECDPPCRAVTYFHPTMLRPYSVAAEVLSAATQTLMSARWCQTRDLQLLDVPEKNRAA